MPPPTGPSRRIAAATLAVLALALPGCTGLTPVNAVTNEAQLLNDLIGRLRARMTEPGATGYTATYQLAGGRIGEIVQRADSSAYRHPDGVLILTATRTANCRGPLTGAVTCELGPAQPAAPAAMFAPVTRRGLITAPVLIDLLQTAASRPTWLSEQHDSTISGLPATCVSIKPTDDSGAYTACVTTDGIIGSVAGRIAGLDIDQNLTDYADTAAADAFDIPAGASIANRPI
jgi:hypothetical protein